MSEEMIYPPGTAIAFTMGIYSDYKIIGHLILMKRCDVKALVAEYRRENPPEYRGDETNIAAFVAWLVTEGHAFPADVSEIHLGDYSGFDVEFGTADPPAKPEGREG